SWHACDTRSRPPRRPIRGRLLPADGRHRPRPPQGHDCEGPDTAADQGGAPDPRRRHTLWLARRVRRGSLREPEESEYELTENVHETPVPDACLRRGPAWQRR